LPFFEKTILQKNIKKSKNCFFTPPKTAESAKKPEFWSIFGVFLGVLAEMPSGAHFTQKKPVFHDFFQVIVRKSSKNAYSVFGQKQGFLGVFHQKLHFFDTFLTKNTLFTSKRPRSGNMSSYWPKTPKKRRKLGFPWLRGVQFCAFRGKITGFRQNWVYICVHSRRHLCKNHHAKHHVIMATGFLGVPKSAHFAPPKTGPKNPCFSPRTKTKSPFI
jgi:hypothetical protein